MSLTTAFTVSQSALSPSVLTVVDSSSGSDVAVTQRRLFIQDAYGSYLVPSGTSTDYIQWSYSDASISPDVLSQDSAVSITVQWLSVTNVVLYTLTQVFCCPQFNKNFFYYLIQQQALTPNILSDTNYFSNMATYWMNITGAIQAVEIGADISASQACLDRATNMLNNQNLYF